MPNHCLPCNRTFKSQQALDQHMQFSTAHKSASPIFPRAHTSSSSPLQSVNCRTSSVSQPDAVASSSSTSQVIFNLKDRMFPNKRNRWSEIPALQQPAVLEALMRHCHSPENLLENRYLLHPYTAEDLAGLRKCKNCGVLQKNALKWESLECRFHPGKQVTTSQNRNDRPFSCCGTTTKRGCTLLPTHDVANVETQLTVKFQSFRATPPACIHKPTFRAVTLDCEMAGVTGGQNELILLCVADYFTGAILLNRLVSPTQRVTDWRRKIHGVTASVMELAIRQGQALAGWREARDELWKFIDGDTILVGHALHHDLDVLRMIHRRVVDSAILARNAVGMSRQWGLKDLCNELLHIGLRENKAGVHDCMEDVLATREVVLWCIRNQQGLHAWAKIKRLNEEHKEEERKKAQLAKKNQMIRRISAKELRDHEEDSLRNLEEENVKI